MAKKPEKGPVVTTSELTATNAAERNALTHLAADARMLTHNTHPNLVPVVEARWLAANRLLITRAKVKGSTLRQTLYAAGPMQEPRAIEILKDVGGVLDWAARGNIVNRQVTSDSVCFEKDTGRVMVSFGLPAVFGDEGVVAGNAVAGADTAFLFERCADGATLAHLAYEMLTAHRAGEASIESLKAVRPETSPEMVAAIDAGLSCSADASLSARQFLAKLPDGGGTPSVGVPAIAAAAAAPIVPKRASAAVPPSAPAARPEPDAVTVPAPRPGPAAAPPPAGPPARRRGRGLLIASMLALVLLVGTTFALIQRERGSDESRIAMNQRDADAGDVDVIATEPLPPDPGGLTTDRDMPTQPEVPRDTLPSSLPSNLPAPLPEQLPPAREPMPETRPEQEPQPVQQAPPPPEVPREAAPPPSAAATGCSSPAMADQRACLNNLIASNDQELNAVYGALIRTVEERQGEAAAERIRVDQRAWLNSRDRACRTPEARDGTLWARERAACLARRSDARALELARALASARSG